MPHVDTCLNGEPVLEQLDEASQQAVDEAGVLGGVHDLHVLAKVRGHLSRQNKNKTERPLYQHRIIRAYGTGTAEESGSQARSS